ncbi:hypothetical protein EIP91_006447 [Steccherinum ochraceum]|uniref:DNA 3'-5' helicase n=1 Tax=Steccherinum ochraceum TaxID=92696 RepID=A0A4R0RE14_9APHY|nr:hypothetical protein EIP91_006447 [Steccherinum ochraceum]
MSSAVGGAEPYKPSGFRSADGQKLLKNILTDRLPYEPHDYQLEGVGTTLEKQDLLAILPTGAGKTGFFTMYMIAMLALSEKPTLCDPPLKEMPKDPVMVVVCPTLGLEVETSKAFENHGLRSLVINNETVKAARDRGDNIWASAVSGYHMIVLSPEMLNGEGFRKLVENPSFASRICALGVDEVHLCYTWAGFRKDYGLINHTRMRLTSHVPLILITATLRGGEPTRKVISDFGLVPGRFHLIHRSNIRRNIQVILRTPLAGINGAKFPHLDCVLEERRKTLIFAQTTAQVNRIRDYLHKVLAAKGVNGSKHMRTYASVLDSDTNADTLTRFRDDPDMHIIIATDALMVGIDLPNVQDVFIMNGLTDLDSILQKIGRAMRKPITTTSLGRGVIFVTESMQKTAKAMVDGTYQKKRKKQKNAVEIDAALAEYIAATCKTEAQDRLYANPADKPGCVPEPQMAKPPSVPKVNPIKQGKRLTLVMKAHGRKRFQEWREKIYDNADSTEAATVPKFMYLPDHIIDTFLDRFALLENEAIFREIITPVLYAMPHYNNLYFLIAQLRGEFAFMKEEKERLKKLEKAQARAAAAGEVVESGSDDSGSDSSLDLESQDEDDYNVDFVSPRLRAMDISDDGEDLRPTVPLDGMVVTNAAQV